MPVRASGPDMSTSAPKFRVVEQSVSAANAGGPTTSSRVARVGGSNKAEPEQRGRFAVFAEQTLNLAEWENLPKAGRGYLFALRSGAVFSAWEEAETSATALSAAGPAALARSTSSSMPNQSGVAGGRVAGAQRSATSSLISSSGGRSKRRTAPPEASALSTAQPRDTMVAATGGGPHLPAPGPGGVDVTDSLDAVTGLAASSKAAAGSVSSSGGAGGHTGVGTLLQTQGASALSLASGSSASVAPQLCSPSSAVIAAASSASFASPSSNVAAGTGAAQLASPTTSSGNTSATPSSGSVPVAAGVASLPPHPPHAGSTPATAATAPSAEATVLPGSFISTMQPEQVAQYLKQYKTALNALSHLKVSITSLGKGLGIQQVPAGTPVAPAVTAAVTTTTVNNGAGSGTTNGVMPSGVSAGTTPRVEDVNVTAATAAVAAAASPADKLLSSELESAHAVIAALQAKLRERDEQIKELMQSASSGMLTVPAAAVVSPTSPSV